MRRIAELFQSDKRLTGTPVTFLRACAIALIFILAAGAIGADRREVSKNASTPIVRLSSLQTPYVQMNPATELLHEDLPVQVASISAPPTPKQLVIGKLLNPKESLLDTSGSRMWMEVTAYCACPKCCGPKAKGITASGKPVSYNNGVFVAADTRLLPFGTKVAIPGYNKGHPVEVIDKGGAIKGQKLDVFFASHQTAKEWGRRWIRVDVAK